MKHLKLKGTGAAAVAVALTCGAVMASSGSAAPPADDVVVRALATQSDTLVSAPAVPLGGIQLNDVARVRATAERIAQEIPIPPGGNFNGIRWDLVPGLTPNDVRFTLEYNAGCQWARAVADGRAGDAAIGVLAQVADWPTIRLTETAFVWQHWAKDARAGEPAPQPCVDLLERERAYAAEQGLTPNR